MSDIYPKTLRQLVIGFIRKFGLLDQSRTPCGHPIALSAAHALMELLHNPGIDQSELSRRLALSKSNVSRMLAKLAKQGHVKRIQHENDGRAHALHLTVKGRRLASSINENSLARFGEIIDSLPDGKRDQLFESLSILIQAIPEPLRDSEPE